MKPLNLGLASTIIDNILFCLYPGDPGQPPERRASVQVIPLDQAVLYVLYCTLYCTVLCPGGTPRRSRTRPSSITTQRWSSSRMHDSSTASTCSSGRTNFLCSVSWGDSELCCTFLRSRMRVMKAGKNKSNKSAEKGQKWLVLGLKGALYNWVTVSLWVCSLR